MIRKFKMRIIVMATILSILLITVFVGAINLTNYVLVRNRAEDLLDLLEKKNGNLESISQEDIDAFGADPWVSVETPYDTRYFYVKLSLFGGNPIAVNTEKIKSINADSAKDLANKAIAEGRDGGYIFAYRYRVSVTSEGTTVYFVDMSRDRQSSLAFLRNSASVAIGLLSVVFILIVFFSNRIVKPLCIAHERQKRFIADAGHEMKTPLTIISANNEIIEMMNGESDCTAAIDKQVKRMTEMVKRLSALARMDTAEMINNPTTISLSDLVSEEAEAFLPTLESEKRKANIKVDKNGYIYADEYLIREMLEILFDNARKYAKSKIEVVLSVHKGRPNRLVFRNDAEGIPVGNLPEFFERFFRTDTVRGSSIEGSGIGLSLAKEIVERFDGQIGAYGTEDGFFEIRISFPHKSANG